MATLQNTGYKASLCCVVHCILHTQLQQVCQFEQLRIYYNTASYRDGGEISPWNSGNHNACYLCSKWDQFCLHA